MNAFLRRAICAATVLALLALPAFAQKAKPAKGGSFQVPVEHYKLPNGLKVILSPDHSAPAVAVAVYYNIGFRIEPKDRTGFAHLFEHMMFQGSRNLGKMEFIKLIQANGGILNGSTRFDYTNYFEVVPAHKLETALWAEADRMKGLAITEENLKNQQGVVSNEVKVNVLNQPYGGFPWLDMPQYANTNWYNAHNFYGDLKDLEAATLQDVKKFFELYYAPNNAALALVGDFDVAEAKKMIAKHFGGISRGEQPKLPDLAEPRQEQEKRASKEDAIAKRPALGWAYHMPERNTPEYWAMGILDQVLAKGEDSLLYQELVKKRALTGGINAGINIGLGNMFNYNGPMLYTLAVFHDQNVTADQILEASDAVIERVQSQPLDQATIDRALVKLRSSFYDMLTGFGGFGRADLLASFALFDDNPAQINQVEANFKKVTPELIQKTAREYLRKTNRTVLEIKVKPAEQKAD